MHVVTVVGWPRSRLWGYVSMVFFSCIRITYVRIRVRFL